jgi:hypothetical protein
LDLPRQPVFFARILGALVAKPGRVPDSLSGSSNKANPLSTLKAVIFMILLATKKLLLSF